MNLNAYFKSVIDQDTASVVLCDLQHTILYMYPAAIRNYAKRGGAQLIGRNEKQNKDVYMVALRDADGTLIGYYEKHEFRSPETMERYAF